MDTLEKYLIPIASYLENNKVVKAISGGLMSLMPVLMIGAISSLFLQIPIEIYQSFLELTNINIILQGLVDVTTNLLALYSVFSIANKFVENEKMNGVPAGLLSLLAFLIVTPLEKTGEGYEAVTNLPFTWLGSMGVIGAMMIAVITGYLYVYLVKNEITIKMPESVPPMISASFAGIVPGIIIATVFAIISGLVNLSPVNSLHELIYGLISAPLTQLGSSIWTALLIYILIGLCWFFGIHGIAVISVMMPIWTVADVENVSAISAGQVPKNIITYNWLETVSNIGGAGATLGLVLLVTFLAKSQRYKQFGKIALPPSLFSINEPVIFGFPMVLNATLAIPFIFLQPFLILIAYLLTVFGVLPVGNGVGVPVRLPVVSGFLLGGWRLAIWQLVALLISIAAYYPFFKLLDERAFEEESKEEKQYMKGEETIKSL